MTVKYERRYGYVRLGAALKDSVSMKRRSGWSDRVSVGFIMEDITDVTVDKTDDRIITIKTPAFEMWITLPELNLRETEELLRYIENHLEQESSHGV